MRKNARDTGQVAILLVFEIEFYGLFEGYLGQKLTGYGILKPTTHRVLEHKTFKLVNVQASIEVLTCLSCCFCLFVFCFCLFYLLIVFLVYSSQLRENRILPPEPQDLNGLKERLDELTRSFLAVVDKENTESGQIKHSVVDDVRNYVVVHTLGKVMLFFKGDLGHLIG